MPESFRTGSEKGSLALNPENIFHSPQFLKNKITFLYFMLSFTNFH